MKATPNRFFAAIQGHKNEIDRCATDHGKPPPGAKILLVISPEGKTRSVTLEPADVNTSPLGACIKNVLAVAAFPAGRDEQSFTVNLRVN